MILVTVLLIVFLLIAVGVGSVVSVQNSYRMSVNLRGGTSALYLAEAGVEWVKDQVGAAAILPLPLVNAGRRLAAGGFVVTILNSTQVSPLTAQVNVRSIGTLSDSTQTVQAGISKSYDLADGALMLRGESRGVRFSGEMFLIDGRDRDPVTQAVVGGAKPRLGISVAGQALLAQLTDALSNAQVNNIVSAESGRAAVAPSGWIGSDAIARLADGVCGAPLAHVSFVAALSNLTLAERALGSRSAPEIYCFEGATGSGDSVVFNGNVNGAGILIVRNAELVLSGTFAWEGLVIVTGREVGVRVTEVANKDVVGSLVINETGNVLGSGPLMVDVQGNVRLLYSRRALDLAARLIPTSTLQSSYTNLPFTLSQDYWRLVTP